MDKYNFLLLAAGKSSRMKGIHKGKLLFNSNTLLENHLDNIKKIEYITNIVMVCSNETFNIYENIINKFDNIKIIINPYPERGMFSSLIEGVKDYKEKKLNGLFVGNIDCSIKYHTINTIISYINHSPPIINKNSISIIPEYKGKKGHPKFFNNNTINKLKIIKDFSNKRLDLWLEKNTKIIRLPINDYSITMNINTPNEYKYWSDYLSNRN